MSTSEIQAVIPLEHKVRLLGAKEPYNMFAIELDPSGMLSVFLRSIRGVVWLARHFTLTCFVMLTFVIEGKDLATLATFFVLLHITTNSNVV